MNNPGPISKEALDELEERCRSGINPSEGGWDSGPLHIDQIVYEEQWVEILKLVQAYRDLAFPRTK